jgi:thiamine-phosphate pyrophosphorylase
LIVASDLELAQRLGADGVHLAGRDAPARSLSLRTGLLAGRSCHDATDVRDAIADAVDYVTVSPVYATSSKPGYGPPLGPDGLRALTRIAGATRVYALGGVDAAAVTDCLAAGASGVAVMGAVMRADDPATEVAHILAALRQLTTAQGARR